MLACWSTGKLFLSRLKITLFAGELQLFRFATGAALFSLLIMLLTCANLAREWVLLAAGLAVILPAWLVRQERMPLPALPPAGKLLFGVDLRSFRSLLFCKRHWRRRLVRMAPSITWVWSPPIFVSTVLGASQRPSTPISRKVWRCCFLVAFAMGRHSAAALVEFSFLIALPLAMIAYGQRFDMPKVGIAAATVIFCSPVFAISGTSAYNDVAAAFTFFCAFYALRIWDETRQPGLLIAVGVLAGFGYGIKYTLALGVLYCCGFIAWRLRRNSLKPLIVVAGCAAAFMAPWLIKKLGYGSQPRFTFRQ